MNAILERQIHAARLLAAQDPPKRTGRGRDPRTGREFTFAPASEYMRVLRAVLPQAGLILRPVGAKITPEGLERTYRLTHDPTQTGASEEWTTVTPLDRSVPADLAAVWARTHSLVAVIKDLLLPDEEEVPDPSERATSRRETQEDRDAREERVHAAREERRRAKASLPDRNERGQTIVCGERPPFMRDSVKPEAKPVNMDQLADEMADALGVTIPNRATLEDRLRVELERTRDQIQTREAAEDGAASPAPGSLSGAALHETTGNPGDLTPPPAESSTASGTVLGAAPSTDSLTDAGTPPAGGSTLTVEESSPAPERVSPGQGASPGRAFVDAFLDRLADGGVVVDVTRLRTAEQATAIARAWEDAPEGSRVVVFASESFSQRPWGATLVENVLPSWDLTRVIETGGVYIPGQGTMTLILVGRAAPPSGTPVRVLYCHRGEPRKPDAPEQGVVWQSVLANYDRPGHRDEWTWCADVPRHALAIHPWRLDRMDGLARFAPPSPEELTSERPSGEPDGDLMDVYDDEGDGPPDGWCGRVGADYARCSTCGRSKAPRGRSVSPETPMCDDDCPGYRDAPHADQLWPGERCAPPLCQHRAPGPDVRCVSCEEPISGESADEEDGGPLCSMCAGPVKAPSPEQVNVVSNVATAATASAQRHQGHEGTTHYEGDDCPPAGLSPRHGNPERRARGAKWAARPFTAKARKDAGECAECNRQVVAGQGYYRGSEGWDKGMRLTPRGVPCGIAHESCVRLLEEGRDPRAEEATTA